MDQDPKKRPRVVLDSQFGPLQAFAEDFINSQVTQFGNHTRPDFAFGTALLDFDMDAFDLGAHIGTFALVAARKLAPGHRLLAVEGSAETYRLLEANVAAHGAGRVETRHAFVGPGGAYGYVVDPGNSGANHLAPAEGEALAAVPIDTLVDEHFAPDFVKLDLEGFEYRALSTSRFFDRARPILYMEVSRLQLGYFGDTVEQVAAWLAERDYRLYRNVGPRNARHDLFRVAAVPDLPALFAEAARPRRNYDMLCVPAGSRQHDALRRVAD